MVSAEADAANPAIIIQANFLSMIGLTSLFQTAHVECHSDGAFSPRSIAGGTGCSRGCHFVARVAAKGFPVEHPGQAGLATSGFPCSAHVACLDHAHDHPFGTAADFLT
jgi:hypothetical protein